MSFAPLSLTAHRRPAAAGGKPRRLVLLLHGYGADGQDLLGLAPYWEAALPDCASFSARRSFAFRIKPPKIAPAGEEEESLLA